MRILSILFLSLFIAQPAMAQTLEERQQLRDWSERLAGAQGEQFESDCGYELPVTLDPGLAAPFMEDRASANGYCGAVVNAMAGMCRADEVAKRSITERVRSYECHFDAENREGRFEFTDDGVLRFHVNNNTPNIDRKAREFLGQALQPDGLNLEQRQQMERWNEQLERNAPTFEERCGYALDVSLDDSVAAPFMEERANGSGSCSSAMRAMWTMCSDDMAREAIQESIQRLECSYESGARTGVFELRDGTFRFSYGTSTPNVVRIVTEYLSQTL